MSARIEQKRNTSREDTGTRMDFAAVTPLNSLEQPEAEPVAVTVRSREELLCDLSDRLAAGLGFSVATLNLDHLVKMGRDAAFRRAYAAQTHVTADGNPIRWLCRIAGQDVALIPGSELVEPVAELAAARGVRVALLGATDTALAAAEDSLTARFADLRVVARIAPPMGFDPEGPGAEEAIDRLRASGASLCFLALGAPKQEIFAACALAALPGTGFLSIGAGLDFLAGTQTRAPVFLRRLALEWLWRLAGNPRRLAARYGACLMILPRAIRTARRIGAGREV